MQGAENLRLTNGIIRGDKARHDYKRLRPKYASKRHENMQLAVVRSIPEVFPRSLILRYYLHGAKTFRKLTGHG